MKLANIIKDIRPVEINGKLEQDIEKIVYDSRQAEDNCLFICIKGLQNDGHDYIDKAIQNGAKAIVIEKKLDHYQQNITYILVDNSREAMSFMAAAFYNYPLKNLSLIGVTGTNGKTTTTYLIKNILEKAGIKTGLIGTIKVIIGDKTLPATRTTPESLDLYHIFAKMLNDGITHVVMEVSSHALDLKRVIGMEFLIGVFTNITQDHLDYHKSISQYLQAKSKLFQQIKPVGYAVVNADDQHYESIIKASRGKTLTYAVNNQADLKADEIQLSLQGARFSLKGEREFTLDFGLTGLFNIYNALAAISCGIILGLPNKQIQTGLEDIKGVDGRFELVDEGQNFAVVVDYAHTPDGMENVLKAAEQFVKGNIIIVFGCGGDRDRGKRPLMGEIAAKYGDFTVITSDNPRSEEPLDIINEIEAGILKLNREVDYEIKPDRKEAIYRAINQAKPGDMVIVFGKGHETYQIFKDKTISFDDREVAREALHNRGGVT